MLFFGKTQELVVEVDPQLAHDYVQQILEKSVAFSKLENPQFRSRVLQGATEADESALLRARLGQFRSVELPLYSVRQKRMHDRSGLNWGQRPGRDPDQAYIPVPTTVARSGFFPPRQTFFTMMTDDDQVFECVIAQDNDKGIETPESNALLGFYFRMRLGEKSGDFVTLDNLDKYGRRTVTVYRITEDKYFMDFSL